MAEPESPESTDRRAAEREAMVREIAAETRLTERWVGKTAFARRVMAAMGAVPRHEFVPASEEALAYRNAPLPIGHGQTISQPYIVALMSDLADVHEGDVVLEVGTGCGYQAAVLAELGGRVYSIELEAQLAEGAAKRLERLGYRNVQVRSGDGYQGWPEHAPFDAIVVTAGAREIPPPLIEQLKSGGRMVIPVDSGPFAQDLILLEKGLDGAVKKRTVVPVAFVPLRRAPGWGGGYIP